MSAAPPWSVKGIDPESRQAAKSAARRAGLTLGAWLSQTIRSAASGELALGPAAPGQADDADGGAAAFSLPDLSELRGALDALSLRLDRHEAWTEEALAPLGARVEQLAAAFAELRAGSEARAPELAGVVLPMSDRLEALSEELHTVRERGESLQADTTRALSPMVSRIEEIAREITELRADRETAGLAEQLARLSAKVDQMGQAAPPAEGGNNPALERSVVRLAERLERLEQALEETRPKGMFGIRRS